MTLSDPSITRMGWSLGSVLSLCLDVPMMAIILTLFTYFEFPNFFQIFDTMLIQKTTYFAITNL